MRLFFVLLGGLFLSILCAASAWAQPAVTGTVRSAEGAPIVRASVAVLNTQQGAATDADGQFSLALPEGTYRLRVSAVGYAAVVRPVTVAAGGATLDVVLQPDAVLGEVIVSSGRFADPFSATATKSAVPILEAPQSVSAVPSAFIDALNLRTVAEALNYTPGVRSQAFGSDPRIDYYQIRGFTSNALFKNGLLLLNSGFSQWTTPPEGIERLDVLRGPSSVLYGGSNPGGLVNIVTRPPDGQRVRTAEAGADEFGTLYASGDLGGRLAEGLAGRAVGLLRAGETQNTARDDRAFGAFALGWTLDDRLSVVGRLSLQRDRAERPTGFLPYEGTVEPLDYGRIPADLFISDPDLDVYDRDQVEVGYSVVWRATDRLTLRQNARAARLDLTYAGLFGLFSGNPLPENPRLIARGNSSLENAQDNLTLDTQAALEVTTGPLRHRLLAGIDVAHNALDNAQRVGGAPPLDVLDPDYAQPIPDLGPARETSQRIGQVGVYAQDAVRWGDVVLSAAGRHDWLDLSATAANGTESGSTPSNFSGRLGAVYVSPVGIAPYVSTSTSFTPLIGASDATGAFYQPETGAQVEAGVRVQPRGVPLLATAAAFTLTRDGVLVRAPTDEFPRNQEQAGEIRSRGVEASLTAAPVQGLTFTAAATGFRIENRAGDDAGRRPTATPERLASAFADYRLGGGPLAGLGGGLGVRFTGRSFADAENTLEVPSATVLDAALHYERNPLRLALNVSNLLDKEYVGACPGAGTCYYANVRRATLSLSASF